MPEMYALQAGSKPIFSLESDEETTKFTPNILPCRIHHDGPIESTDRFWIPQTDEKGTHPSIIDTLLGEIYMIVGSNAVNVQTVNKQHTSVDAGCAAGAWLFPRVIKVRELLGHCLGFLTQLANFFPYFS